MKTVAENILLTASNNSDTRYCSACDAHGRHGAGLEMLSPLVVGEHSAKINEAWLDHNTGKWRKHGDVNRGRRLADDPSLCWECATIVAHSEEIEWLKWASRWVAQ